MLEPTQIRRKTTGAKLALKPVNVWGIRIRLQVAKRTRDLALFDLALDSKLRGCDLMALRVSDVISAGGVKRRVMILQRKTGRPVQFEVTEQARRSVGAWIETKQLSADDWLFPSRMIADTHLSTRQYARLVDINGSHSSRWTRRHTARTACAGRRYHCSTKRQGICAPVSCCSDTPSSKALSGILAWRWMTRWRCQKRLSYERPCAQWVESRHFRPGAPPVERPSRTSTIGAQDT